MYGAGVQLKGLILKWLNSVRVSYPVQSCPYKSNTGQCGIEMKNLSLDSVQSVCYEKH